MSEYHSRPLEYVFFVFSLLFFSSSSSPALQFILDGNQDTHPKWANSSVYGWEPIYSFCHKYFYELFSFFFSLSSFSPLSSTQEYSSIKNGSKEKKRNKKKRKNWRKICTGKLIAHTYKTKQKSMTIKWNSNRIVIPLRSTYYLFYYFSFFNYILIQKKNFFSCVYHPSISFCIRCTLKTIRFSG